MAEFVATEEGYMVELKITGDESEPHWVSYEVDEEL